MPSALDVQSVFLDMSCSTTAGHLHHSAQALRLTETITSASQLENPSGPGRTEQSACEAANRDPQKYPQQFEPKN
jgi:hypothetical protein